MQQIILKVIAASIFALVELMNCNTIVLAQDNLMVCVSIAPQEYFVKKIGGGLVTVEVLVPPGASPATYDPKPGQMRSLNQSRIYFSIGVPFEKRWLETFVRYNPSLQVIETQAGIEQLPFEYDHDHDHESDIIHKPSYSTPQTAAPQERQTMDPHIWLSPPLVIVQAKNIHRALVIADPINQAIYDLNLQSFLGEINAIDTQFRKMFATQKGLEFMVFHPSWGYFAHTYGLRQLAVESFGRNPGPKKLKSLVDYAITRDIQAIFVQPQIASKYADVIASAIGGKVIIADPLALDWAKNLRRISIQLKEVLR